jgi:DNA-binding transcriptional ArsR family regulator
MVAQTWMRLRWVKQVQVPVPPTATPAPIEAAALSTRDRLVAALADRPRTVAQLAQAFGLSQPTVLEQVRRALRDGLIVEVEVAEEEKRFAAERYYAPAVPVIRQPDRELLQSACRALADEAARALSRRQGDLQAAFAMTTLAREGWTFDDLWPYLHETVCRLALERVAGTAGPATPQPHGLAWVEDIAELAFASDDTGAVREEESA